MKKFAISWLQKVNQFWFEDQIEVDFTGFRLHSAYLAPPFPPSLWTRGFWRQNNVMFHGAKLFQHSTSPLVHLTLHLETYWILSGKDAGTRPLRHANLEMDQFSVHRFATFAFYLRILISKEAKFLKIVCKSDTAGLLKTWFSVKNFTEKLRLFYHFNGSKIVSIHSHTACLLKKRIFLSICVHNSQSDSAA